MNFRVLAIAVLSVASSVLASAMLWYYVIRDEPQPSKAKALPVLWVESTSPGNLGPSEAWSLTKLRSFVADNEQTPEHRAQAIYFLARENDWEGVDTLIELLDDPLPLLRGRAAAAIRHILGTEFYYRAADDRSDRLDRIDEIRRYWSSRKDNLPRLE